jgi:hypothetical protein
VVECHAGVARVAPRGARGTPPRVDSSRRRPQEHTAVEALLQTSAFAARIDGARFSV